MNKHFQETASLSIVLILFIHKISSKHDRVSEVQSSLTGNVSGALQRCLEECLKPITLSVTGNRFAVVAVEIRPPPART